MPTPRINHRALLFCDSSVMSCDVWLGGNKIDQKIKLHADKQT